MGSPHSPGEQHASIGTVDSWALISDSHKVGELQDPPMGNEDLDGTRKRHVQKMLLDYLHIQLLPLTLQPSICEMRTEP